MAGRERVAIWPADKASRMTVRAPEVLTATRTISLDEMERFQSFAFGPNAASRNVDLPPVANCEGAYVLIANLSTTAGATLVVRDAAAVTILTVPITTAGARKAAVLFCDGANWYGLLGA